MNTVYEMTTLFKLQCYDFVCLNNIFLHTNFKNNVIQPQLFITYGSYVSCNFKTTINSKYITSINDKETKEREVQYFKNIADFDMGKYHHPYVFFLIFLKNI